jgi:hypothetical protein
MSAPVAGAAQYDATQIVVCRQHARELLPHRNSQRVDPGRVVVATVAMTPSRVTSIEGKVAFRYAEF